MARFDQNIKTPNHQFLTLSDGSRAYAVAGGSAIEIVPAVPGVAVLDPNDAIRLAAWLNRYYTEHNAQEAKSNG